MDGQLKWLIVFVDVLLGLVGILALTVYALAISVNPPTKPMESIKPPGQIAVSVCWPKGSNDIDTWADAPGEPKPVGYLNKVGKIWSLLLDNRGEIGGKSPANCEAMFARDLPAGEYTVNLFGFSVSEPVSVHVEIGIGASGEDMHTLTRQDMIINSRQERTVIRFMVDDNGQVVPGSINQVFRPLYIGGGS